MTTEPLERLQRANPVSPDPGAPPIDALLRRIAAEEGARRPPRRSWRPAHSLAPALAVAAALAVAVLAVVLLGHRAHGPTATTGSAVTTAVPGSSTTTAAQPPRAPRSGMRGDLDVLNATGTSTGTEVISFSQCPPCRNAPAGAVRNWLATSRDGGRTWRVQRQPYLLQDPAFSGARDGWSEGSAGDDHVYVTHDGGRTWTVAHTADPTAMAGVVSIADGEVWRGAEGCRSGTCTGAIARGPAAGSALSGVAASPVSPAASADVRAAGRDAAYLESITDSGTVTDFATADGGRSWHRITTACRPRVSTGIESGGGGSLWELCPVPHETRLRVVRSADGGRHWQVRSAPPGGTPTRLWPFSAQTAWTLTTRGRVMRTIDGGAHWSAVWSGNAAALGLRGPVAGFSAQSGNRAEVVTEVRGRTRHRTFFNLVLYRTTDGGRTWRVSVVALPAG